MPETKKIHIKFTAAELAASVAMDLIASVVQNPTSFSYFDKLSIAETKKVLAELRSMRCAIGDAVKLDYLGV